MDIEDTFVSEPLEGQTQEILEPDSLSLCVFVRPIPPFCVYWCNWIVISWENSISPHQSCHGVGV